MYCNNFHYPVKYHQFFYMEEKRISVHIDVMRQKVKAVNHETKKTTYRDIDDIKDTFFGIKKEYILERINP